MGNYNTQGILLNNPAPSAGKAGDANAAVKASDEQISTIDALQMLLDVVGLIPGLGAPADLLNGLISAGRGDWIGAGLSMLGVVPVAGEAATAAKIAKNSEKYLKGLQVVADKVLPNLPGPARRKLQEALDSAKAKIDELAGNAANGKSTTQGREAPRPANQGKNGGKIRPRQHKVPCFHPYDKKKFSSMAPAEQRAYLKEMADQLKRQQDAINSMTAAEYQAARQAFSSLGRNPAAAIKQAAVRDDAAESIRSSIRSSLRSGGMSAAEAKKEAAKRTTAIMERLAALHEPDMVAGGWLKPDPAALGRSDVNSSIGSSWNQGGRAAGMDAAAEDAIRSGHGNEPMNVKLEPCRGKGMR